MDTLRAFTRDFRTQACVVTSVAVAAFVWAQTVGEREHGAALEPRLHRLSKTLNLKAGERYDRVLDAIQEYLGRVEKSLPHSHDGGLRHSAWGAYGSGFLTHNRVSNDLDVFVNVDLGTVESRAADRRDAADQIWQRVETYRTHAARLAAWEQKPEFALSHFMEGLSGVTPSDYASGLDDLASSLQLVTEQVPYLVAIEYRGGTQISTLESGTGYLPLVTSTTFLSNAVKQTPGVFTGIRNVSVQFYFTVNLMLADERPPRLISRVPLSPLAPPRQVAKLWQQAYSGVHVTKESREFVESVIPADDDWHSTRLSYALGFYGSMAFELDVRRYPVKFFKRLHSWLDVLGQGLGAEERDALFGTLDVELSGDAALVADQMMTLGGVLKDVAGNPETLALFTSSGDLERTLAFFREANGYLRLRYPKLGADLDALAPSLESIPNDPARLREVALTMSKSGLEIMRKLSADDSAMRAMFQRVSRVVWELGYRPVRMYVGEKGDVLLRAEDLACGDEPLGLFKELVSHTALLRRAEFSILEANDPRLTQADALPLPYTQFVLCAESQAEQQALLRTRELFQSSRGDALVRL